MKPQKRLPVDPVWCPTGVVPQNGTGGCTTSYGNLRDLVDALVNGTAGAVPGADGIIWIQGGADNSTGGTTIPIVIDGNEANFGNWENFSLTLRGGWSGTLGTTTVSSLNPSVFDQAISIINWNGAITLSDIVITGASVGDVTNNAVLNIDTTKAIVLINVKVNNNTGAGTVRGAYLNNEDVSPLVFGDVTITNSQFNSNKNDGLTIYSEGTITLAGVLAGGNGGSGASLNNNNAATAKAITIITGTNQFSNNGIIGLYARSKGVITLKDVTANYNGNTGIILTNTYSTTAAAVNLQGTIIASGNDYGGLDVESNGAITASTLVANGNIGIGVSLENQSAAAAQAVTINGNGSQAKFNTGGGFFVDSRGAVTLVSLTATNNSGGWGASIDNTDSTVGSVVTLTGTNVFNNNSVGGLSVTSKGIITTTNITAKDNSGHGVYLNNDTALPLTAPKNVLVNGINTLFNNVGSGLYILSHGAVTVNNLSSTFNSNGDGLYVNNGNITLPQNVTVVGTSTLSNNSTSGLNILTDGIVTVGSITASTNGDYGVYINNANVAKAVTLSGVINTFENNALYGLQIISKGAITVNNLLANSNGSGGASLSALGTTAVGVTINGTSSFNYNGGTGLGVYTNGNILIKDFDASFNNLNDGSYGLLLNNANGVSGTGNVTLGTTRVNWINDVNGNYDAGISIISNGTVSLFNISASNNGHGVNTPGGYGLSIDNTGATTPKTVTLNGVNQFDDNYFTGAQILTKGAVVVNKITANGNGTAAGYHGLEIVNNANPLVPQNVSILGYGNFSGNAENGLSISTYGTVALANISAHGNGLDGVYVDNSTGTLVRGVTQTGTISASNNGNVGVDILTLGVITLNNLYADNNTIGANLRNDGPSAVGAVTITGYATLYNSSSDGLNIFSRGNITITNLDASYNGSYGATLNNTAGTGTVSLLTTVGGKTYAWSNGQTGIEIDTKRAVSLANLDVYNNNGDGVSIANTASGEALPQSVSITGSNYFMYNYNGHGLFIETFGAVTANNVIANGNQLDGAYITNWDGLLTLPQNVTLTGVNSFSENGENGLEIMSIGAVITNNLSAYSNGQNAGFLGHGVIIDNCKYDTNPPHDCLVITPKPVTLNGVNNFSFNHLAGLSIYSKGQITINNVTANQNDNDGGNNDTGYGSETAGVYLNNQVGDSLTAAGITLTGVNTFIDNNGTGLTIYTNGTVALSNITASGNSGLVIEEADGVYIEAFNNVKQSKVNLTGFNSFNENQGNGLVIFAEDAITISNLTANENGSIGALLDNYNNGNHWTSSMIKITGFSTVNGNGTGMILETYGLIDLTKVTADNNTNTGLGAISHNGAIMLTCGSMTNNNDGWNLSAFTTITLKGVFSTANLNLDEDYSLPAGVPIVTRNCPLP